MKKKNRKVVISIIATLIVICTIIVSIFNNGIIETFANTYPTNLWNGNFDWDSQLIVDQHEVDYVYQGGKYLKMSKCQISMI